MKLGLTSKNRLADARASGWPYPLTDGRTRIRGVTDAGGSVVETTDYSPLGVPTTPLTRTPYHFTGEIRDGVGLQYHRARHYAPSLGTWTALDPFEGVTGRPMSLNGYLWVEGNTPNATDPSGLVTVKLWAAAFISPNNLVFPYPDRVDLVANWHGDNRGWFTRSDFANIPLSSRAWWSLEFDMEDHSTITAQTNRADTGVTIVEGTVTSVGGAAPYVLYRNVEKSPAPSPANVSCRGDSTIISISARATNPLANIIPAPPIEIDYEVEITPSRAGGGSRNGLYSNGYITLNASIDRYPWHELYVMVDDTPVIISRKLPQNPPRNPSVLFLPAYSFSESSSTYGPVNACNYSNRSVSFRPKLPVDIPCVFA